MDSADTGKFIESWGTMGSVWGINTSIARVHALLIVSDEPLSFNSIAEGLAISRGNASMCLRELRNWGIVRLVKEPGDRQDYYVTEPDVWKMFFAISRERKRREFDPALNVVRETLKPVSKGSGGVVLERLKQLEQLLSTLDTVSSRLLKDDAVARAALGVLKRLPGARGAKTKG